MVFIHGGGYILGSSATPLYDGAALARRGCVYVSVNYRLGALGCLDLSSLSTATITIESNLYLRDLVLALQLGPRQHRRVRRRSDNVTVFGESAGAHQWQRCWRRPPPKGCSPTRSRRAPRSGMVRSRERRRVRDRFANLLGLRTQDAANALMQAPRPNWWTAQDRLIDEGMQNRLGAFPIGPVFGDDYLPMDRSRRCGAVARTRCRSSWAPTPKRAACSPVPDVLPTNESMIEGCWPTRNRLPANVLPPPTRTTRRRPRASSSAATSRSARRPGRSPRPTAATRPPTCTDTTTRQDVALVRSGRNSRDRVAGCLRRLPHQVRRAADRRGRPAAACGSATRYNGAGARSAAPANPVTAGRLTPTTIAR